MHGIKLSTLGAEDSICETVTVYGSHSLGQFNFKLYPAIYRLNCMRQYTWPSRAVENYSVYSLHPAANQPYCVNYHSNEVYSFSLRLASFHITFTKILPLCEVELSWEYAGY